MPPKRDGAAINGNTNNTVNNSEIATTTTSNNATLAMAMNLHTSNTNTTAAAQTYNSNGNSSSMVTATMPPTTITANGNNALPVLIQDAAAEQRTIAYQANARLCRLVRKCPWMYDRNHHNYAKKHILDKSWCKIARECNDSGE